LCNNYFNRRRRAEFNTYAEQINGFRTLVLNADFRPLNYFPLSICSWQEAIKALHLGRVEVVSEYDKAVRSPSIEIKIPSVICLKRYIKAQKEVPSLTRANLFLRDEFICQYCENDFSNRELTMDHLIPKSKGGKTNWNNIATSCHKCNSAKGNKTAGKNFRNPLTRPWTPSTLQLQSISRKLSSNNLHESWLDYL